MKLANFSAEVSRLRRVAKACAAGEISRSEYRRNRRRVIEVYTGSESSGDETVPRFDGDTAVRRDFDFVQTGKQSNGRTSLVWFGVIMLLVGALLAPTFVWASQTISAVQERQANPNLSERFLVESISWQVPEKSELVRVEVNELLARSLARIRASYQAEEHGFTGKELQQVAKFLNAIGLHDRDVKPTQEDRSDLKALVERQKSQRKVSLKEIENVASELQAWVRAQGYPVAVAYVPSQTIDTGEVKLAVQLGHLAEVAISVNGSEVATSASVWGLETSVVL